MNERALQKWFSDLPKKLESAYLLYDEPWKQSGFSGPEERWMTCRKPIADCIDTSGSFLDIGCANGYLLECLLRWIGEKGISIIPYGLDLSEKLVALARGRLPGYGSNIFIGNGFNWIPPKRFDYVRTELCYVPVELEERYVERLINDFLTDNGKLLIAEYRSKKDTKEKEWIDVHLEKMGFAVHDQHSASWEGKELTRIAVLTNAAAGEEA